MYTREQSSIDQSFVDRGELPGWAGTELHSEDHALNGSKPRRFHLPADPVSSTAPSGGTSSRRAAAIGNSSNRTATARATIGATRTNTRPSGHTCRRHQVSARSATSASDSPAGAGSVASVRKSVNVAPDNPISSVADLPVHRPASRSASSTTAVARHPSPAAVCAHRGSGPRKISAARTRTAGGTATIWASTLGKPTQPGGATAAAATRVSRVATAPIVPHPHDNEPRLAPLITGDYGVLVISDIGKPV